MGKGQGKGKVPEVYAKVLLEVLKPYTNETRLFSMKAKQPMLRLTSNLKKVYLACRELRACGSYRTICKRLKASISALGVGLAKRQEDLCSVCHCFDTQLRPMMWAKLKRFFQSLNQLEPGYTKASHR